MIEDRERLRVQGLGVCASTQVTSCSAGLRRLQVGLDCARTAGSCAQIELCVAQFRAREASDR